MKYKKTFQFLVDGEIKKVEAQSLKKASKMIHSSKPYKEFAVRYTNKAGNLIEDMVMLPFGRKKKLGR